MLRSQAKRKKRPRKATTLAVPSAPRSGSVAQQQPGAAVPPRASDLCDRHIQHEPVLQI